MSRWMDDAVENYLTELARTEHEDPGSVVAEDTRYVGSIVPIRGGVMTALRIE